MDSRRPRANGEHRGVVSGFSLIELLVALVIFSTMAAISYAGLSAVTRSHAALDERERALADLGRSLMAIERDLRSVARRSIRDGGGARLPALFASGETLELSTHGRGRGAALDLGLVERIAYSRTDDALQRLRWPVLDRVASSRPDQRPILDDVRALRWRFLGAGGRWFEQWPPGAAAGQEAELPRAVEVTLTHAQIGQVRRLIELPAWEGMP